MPLDSPYTKKEEVQFRGPSYSSDYNNRVSDNYKDLTVLYNRVRLGEVELDEFYRRIGKDQLAIIKFIEGLESRMGVAEGSYKTFTFTNFTEFDYERFDGIPEYDISEEERLFSDDVYGHLLLPKIETSSLSKLLLTTKTGDEVVPPSLETRVVPDTSTAESVSNEVDTVDPEFSFYSNRGLIWERNVIASSPDPDGARLDLYIKVPTDLFTTEKSNRIVIHPFPFFGTTIEEISFTDRIDPLLDETDGYQSFNSEEYYAGDASAVGWVIPGGWTGIDEDEDEIKNSGPKSFYFSPKSITALKVTIHQDQYYKENGQYIYSYGLSFFDLKFDKFATQGKAIVKLESPEGELINSIEKVIPRIYNVSPLNVDPSVPEQSHFTWRAIWETAPGSGVYTTERVPNSQRVWIEVTLKELDSIVPALSSFSVDYTSTFIEIDGGPPEPTEGQIIDGGTPYGNY